MALLLVSAAPLVPSASNAETTRFGLLVAFVWIPAAGVAAALSQRHPSRATDLATLVVDLALLAFVQKLLSPAPLVLLAALLLLVAATTYVAGRWLGAAAGLAGMATLIAAAAEGVPASEQVDPFTAAVYPALLLVAAFLLDAAATDRWQANTGLTRMHEKSDAILTGVGEAVVVTDDRGRIGQWNRAAASAFGCPAEEAAGRGCAEILGLLHEVRGLDCSQGCALLELTPEDAGPVPIDVEVWRRSPTGARQPLLASVSPVLDQWGAVVEVVHSFRDITRFKQADEAKTLFLATASHELKTPLTVIRGFSQMLLLPGAELGEAERTSALRAIDARAGQLTAIVDRLLMSSRIEAGRVELALEAVDLVPLLEERASAFEGATGRPVAVVAPDDLTRPWCDLDALATIVDHLLDNAVKYSPDGGPITLAAAATDDTVEVVVADLGIGMTPEQAAHCFDRFWQAEATDVRRFGGTGIGLYIVRSLAEGMDGSIHVTSAPGAGSTFRLTLRRADSLQAAVPSVDEPVRGEQTMIREYMRQLGLSVAPHPIGATGRGSAP